MVHSLDVKEFKNTSDSYHSKKFVDFTLTIGEQINWDDSDEIWEETTF